MSVMPVNTATAKPPASRLGSLGTTNKRSEAHRQSGSLLQRPTEASVAHMSTVLSSKGRQKPKKELTFKQQLLKKTIKESALRPSGVMALHIKQGHFHDIDSGGM